MRAELITSNQINVVWHKSNQSCHLRHVACIWQYKLEREDLLVGSCQLIGKMKRDQPLSKFLKCLLTKDLERIIRSTVRHNAYKINCESVALAYLVHSMQLKPRPQVLIQYVSPTDQPFFSPNCLNSKDEYKIASKRLMMFENKHGSSDILIVFQ